ncbi:DUF1524 domain-containing protein (plasmid) [Tunturiibacter empetritectus]|uniref:GmrSD restriction endonuclease domain-containing protein n=1 Tax=Tunturiibacter empetritectus TaxID=3069691 RepID=UPI003D9ADB10
MLGDSWKEIQDVWVHRLGNITLTGYNQEYSDRSFDNKKSMTGGFSESPLRLNKFVREQNEWTGTEIEKRGKTLAISALKIWRSLQLDPEILKQAQLKRIKAEAAGYTTDSLEIEDESLKVLLKALSLEICGLGDNITEIFRTKSVTYRVFDHFVEVIPRKQHLTLVLNMDFEDCDDPSELARDTSNKAFITNASESGGVSFPLWSHEEIPAAMHVIRQAYEEVVE